MKTIGTADKKHLKRPYKKAIILSESLLSSDAFSASCPFRTASTGLCYPQSKSAP